ncbi:DEKNAAC103185 [Brettanomyces naardenensis]|uniref:DEKNAAC103185 n=1 Tax=Brettanomyces naardenensis TaxID=13370 RepID=A0A448YMK6_BRENA|nr:DEKNAAC103185 [Brettanomyces naardenensis]
MSITSNANEDDVGSNLADESIRSAVNEKLERFEQFEGVDIEEQFQEYERKYQEALKNMSYWDRMVITEIKVHFKNKRNMIWMLSFFASMAGLLSGCDQSYFGCQFGLSICT